MVNELFTLQTKGIERRNKHYKDAWGPHLLNTQKISTKILEPKLKSGKTLTIIGAGRLLDFPQCLYNKFSDQITLVDRSRFALRGFSKNVVCYDITGNLERWCEHLKDIRPSDPEDLLSEIKSISLIKPLLPKPCFKDEILLSLNILSQLPVYWQNAVFSIFRNRFSKKLAEQWEDKILEALLPSFRALIKSHLKTLIPRGRHKESLLITDTHYLEYKVPYSNQQDIPFFSLKSEANNIQAVDLELKTNANKIQIESMDALFGISIGEELSNKCNIQYLDKWLWDIVPFNSEKENLGTSHRVIALKLTR